MKDHINNKLDNYLLGNLSKQEKESFDHELKNNPEMTLQLQERKLILKGLEAAGDADLKKRLKSIHAEYIDGGEISSRKIGPIKTLLKLAAAVLFGFLAFYFYSKSQLNSGASPELLYAKYNQTYDFSSGLHSDQKAFDFSSAVKLYKEGKHDQAVQMLTPLVEKNSENLEYRFALALNTLSTANAAKGKILLQEIIAKDDPLFKDQAVWYLSLQNLKEGNTSKTKELLMLLSKDKNADHHHRAAELLKELH